MSENFMKKEGIDYITNFYRYKLYDNEQKFYLMTLDDGTFLFMDVISFKNFKKGKICNSKVYNILKDKGFIITQDNIDNIIDKTRQRYSFLGNGTSLHIVVPTHRCNMNCIYCFANSKEINEKAPDMTEEIAKKTIEFIMKSPSHAITIEFQGGEPLVAFDKIKIMVKEAKKLNKLYKKDLRFALVSNFTLINEDIANWLIDNDVSFCTSFDGPKEVHDANRFFFKNNNKYGSYYIVTYWIKKINKLYKKKNIKRKVNAVLTITNKSLQYHKEIIDEYMKNNITAISIRPLYMLGQAQLNKNDIYYSKNDFLNFYKKSLKYIKSLNDKNIPVIETLDMLYKKKLLEQKPTYHADFESPCGAATGNIIYFCDGSIYTCNEAINRDEFKLGSIYEKWEDIFKKKETSKAILNSMIESNVICDRCVYKPYCGTCMVENFYNFNKFNFYPTKTFKHHQTIFHCEKFFDSILKQIKNQINNNLTKKNCKIKNE